MTETQNIISRTAPTGLRGATSSPSALLRWGLLAGVVILLLVHLLCLGRYPGLGGDEVYFSPTAYSLITHGVFARPIHPGPVGFTIRDYFPPVVTLIMAGSYEVFGFGGWQTRLGTLLCGLGASSVLFFLVRRLTGSIQAAALAFAVFATNRSVVHAWQTGRYEGVFQLISILIVYCGVIALECTGKRLTVLWGVIGLLTALLAITYYPFAGPGCLVSVLMLYFFLWQSRGLNKLDRLRATAAFGAGALFISGLFAWHVSVRPDLFKAQIVDQIGLYSGSAHGGVRGVLETILQEPLRYLMYAKQDLGLFEVLLEAFAAYIVLRAYRQAPAEQKVWAFLLWSILVWTVFLCFYKPKSDGFLADVVPLSALVVGMAWQQISLPQRWAERPRCIFQALTVLTLVVGISFTGLVGFTTLYQWQGRQYPTFARKMTAIIPAGARVVGPQFLWYALAPRNPLRLYTQGGEQIEGPTGTSQLNELPSLASVDYVVLPSDEFSGRFLPGFVANVHSHFTLVQRIRQPFAPLPWSRASPYDANVYVRSPGASFH